VIVTGDAQIAIPDRASEQVKVTVTGADTVPPGPGTGNAAAVIIGFVLSIFSVTLAEAVCPAASLAVPLIV
jgi:hypothetical protein